MQLRLTFKNNYLVGEGRDSDEQTHGEGELPVVEAKLGNQAGLLLLLLLYK